MNKFDPTLDQKLKSLLVYTLFKNPEGLDAFCISEVLGLNCKEMNENNDEKADLDEPLKSWIRLGSKVNFAWIENHGPLEWLTMGQFQFEKLRTEDPILHAEIKIIRDKANKRWSNDWKQIQPKIMAAKSLISMKPNKESLDLTWRSTLAACARQLQRSNRQDEAKQIQDLLLK